jgi:hypothetical protein
MKPGNRFTFRKNGANSYSCQLKDKGKWSYHSLFLLEEVIYFT